MLPSEEVSLLRTGGNRLTTQAHPKCKNIWTTFEIFENNAFLIVLNFATHMLDPEMHLEMYIFTNSNHNKNKQIPSE